MIGVEQNYILILIWIIVLGSPILQHIWMVTDVSRIHPNLYSATRKVCRRQQGTLPWDICMESKPNSQTLSVGFHSVHFWISTATKCTYKTTSRSNSRATN